MHRSGRAWPWMLLLFGSACGDSVVVARGVSLVSAAESSDAGLWDAGWEGRHRSDAGRDGGSNHHESDSSESNNGSQGSGNSGRGSTDNSKRH